MRSNKKIFVALAAAGLVAASGSAFTATNSVGASNAGSGTTAISGYTTSNVQYTANGTNPENLDAVTFTLSSTARYVALRTKSGGAWYKSNDLRLEDNAVNSCTSSGGLGITWTCNVTGNSETVLAADSLSVVATT